MLTQLLLGLALSALIGGYGYRRRSLSKSGVLGAILVGTLVFGLGGWAWGLLLVAFFASSSALSHFKAAQKESLAEKFSKGHQRDLAQALANGGLCAALAIANALWPHPIWWPAFVGALAAVNADTWATELGVLSRAKPRLITTFQPVERGTSGGVTLGGALAAFSGAAFVALLGGFFAGQWAMENLFAGALSDPSLVTEADLLDPSRIFLNAFYPLVVAASLAGLLGSMFDSLLGATAQGLYYCPACRKETERRPTHTCGAPTRPRRGWRWLDNDGVNFLCSAFGALLAAGMWMVTR
jgi:uncharacterized protein (TIGR00297 family)